MMNQMDLKEIAVAALTTGNGKAYACACPECIASGRCLAVERGPQGEVVRIECDSGTSLPDVAKYLGVPPKPRQSKKESADKESHADALAKLALERYEFGVSTTGDVFAIDRQGPRIAKLFRGSTEAFKVSLSSAYRKATGRIANASVIGDVLLALAGEATETDPAELHLRLARHGDTIVIDLGRQDGQVVVVGGHGWTVQKNSPVLFRRTALTGELPIPSEQGRLELLRGLLNVTEANWRLICGWLIATLIPDVPHPVLFLGGQQGTGKSTTARLLAGIIDPSPVPLQSPPKDDEQWSHTAAGSWLVVIDNVSRISESWSDALCKAVTGDGFVRRRLYTDGDLHIAAFRRAVILTSIDVGALRGDLGDRLLLVDLEQIDGKQRRSEVELLTRYDVLRPALFGGLLDLLAKSLKHLPMVQLDEKPRMADFARILSAVDRADNLDDADGSALKIYLEQRTRIAGAVVDSDPVAVAIIELLEKDRNWTGTARQLLTAISPERSPKGWPASPQAMGGHLKRLIPALEIVGVQVDRGKDGDRQRTRRITLTLTRKQSSDMSDLSADPESPGNSADDLPASSDKRLSACPTACPQIPAQIPWENVAADNLDNLDKQISIASSSEDWGEF